VDSRESFTLIELLHLRALEKRDHPAYTFLTDGETESLCLTYGELDKQARTIGGKLQSLGATGERVVLLYPPSLEYIAAFFGCLCAGVVAVPAYPPNPRRADPRVARIVADCGARLALASDALMARLDGSATVRDNGRGMGPTRTGAFGLRLAESLAGQLGGRLITPAVPKGTLTILTFPYSV